MKIKINTLELIKRYRRGIMTCRPTKIIGNHKRYNRRIHKTQVRGEIREALRDR